MSYPISSAIRDKIVECYQLALDQPEIKQRQLNLAGAYFQVAKVLGMKPYQLKADTKEEMQSAIRRGTMDRAQWEWDREEAPVALLREVLDDGVISQKIYHEVIGLIVAQSEAFVREGSLTQEEHDSLVQKIADIPSESKTAHLLSDHNKTTDRLSYILRNVIRERYQAAMAELNIAEEYLAIAQALDADPYESLKQAKDSLKYALDSDIIDTPPWEFDHAHPPVERLKESLNNGGITTDRYHEIMGLITSRQT